MGPCTAAIRPVAPSASLMRPSRRVAGAKAHSSGTRRGDQGHRVSLVDPGRGALPVPLDREGLPVLLGRKVILALEARRMGLLVVRVREVNLGPWAPRGRSGRQG